MKNKEGILLVELIIAVGIFLLTASGLAALAIRNYVSQYQASDILIAQNIINNKYAELKKIKQTSFQNLVDLQQSNPIEDSFNINERTFVLTTTISDVFKDNDSGKITGSGCVGSGKCAKQDDIKRVVFKVDWNLINGKQAPQVEVVSYFSEWENQ